MPITVLGGTKVADTAFSVANSVRMNGDARMYITPSAGDADKWTFSCWVKRSIITSGSQTLFSAKDGSNNMTEIRFNSNDTIDYYSEDGSGGFSGRLNTSRTFRDPAAWLNVVAVWDSENGTAGNRMRLYINGTEETSFATDTNPSDGDDSYIGTNIVHTVGDKGDDSQNFKGYMAEVYYCNGQAYAASDFGEFDEDSPTIWKPKDASGLTFGTGGFYLDFEASDNLGNDANGGTDLTESGLAAADQAVDSPTNNFCTMNPLDNYYAAGTFSEGNCQVITSAGNTTWGTSTFGLSAGKWYYECKIPTGGLGGGEIQGIIDRPAASTSTKPYNASGGKNACWRSGGDLYIDDSNDTDFTPGGGDLWTADDILGVFLDLDNNKIYCAINGTIAISGVGADITAVASTLHKAYFIIAGDSNTASTTFQFNFGGCSSFALSSAVSDANGYGNFEYSPNQGGASNFDSAAKDFLAICSKNLGSDGG